MSSNVIVTGIRGQDASYLSQLLLKKGYHVVGTDRRSGSSNYWRLDYLGITKDIEFVTMDLLEYANIRRVIEKYKPEMIFNLAAQSFVQDSFDIPLHTFDVNATSVLRLLEAIREVGRGKIKFYQASSSEMFGKVQETPQKETTPFYPRSPYGVAKLAAHWNTINYREAYQMFNCSGILFNHESPLRGLEFVTRKISKGVADIYKNKQTHIEVGNVFAKRDWGHSRDFTEAMFLMLQQKEPDDYVIATGETHTVKDFIDYAFLVIGKQLDWSGGGKNLIAVDKEGIVRVKINPKFYRPNEVDLLLGDPTKAKNKLGWFSKTSLKELVNSMIEYDLKVNS